MVRWLFHLAFFEILIASVAYKQILVRRHSVCSHIWEANHGVEPLFCASNYPRYPRRPMLRPSCPSKSSVERSNGIDNGMAMVTLYAISKTFILANYE